VLSSPTPPKRTSWPNIPRGTPGTVEGTDVPRPSSLRSRATGIRPPAKPRRSRATPARSSFAVATMCTRLSGSSTQSTGTSWMRSPARCAITSSSVSKNQLPSSTSGSRSWATSARIALNPHWASEKDADSALRRIRL